VTRTAKPFRIVLLFGSGVETQNSVALAAESSKLRQFLEHSARPVDVSVISLGLRRNIPGSADHVRLDDSTRSATDRLLAILGAFALRRWFATFPLGRLLNSLGPVDQGRVFLRTAKRHAHAMRLLRSTNVVIATDVESTKLGWTAVHRGWVDDAFYDYRSAPVGVTWQLPSEDDTPRD